MIVELLERLEAGERLASDDYLKVAQEAPLEVLQSLADDLRKRLHPDNIATYIVDRNINYSNILFGRVHLLRFLP